MKRGTRTPRRHRAAGSAAAAAAVLALALGQPLSAQAPQADTMLLTLDDAVRIAESGNPTYVQAENELLLNGPQARSVWLGDILPQASFTLLSTGYGGTLTRRATDFFGNPIENPDDAWVYNSSTRQGLSLNWTLQGLNFLNAKRQLDQDRVTRDLGVGSARASLRADVRRQYQNALQQRELLDVEESLAEARANDLESARRLFELARTSQVDVLNAEVAVDQQAIDIQQQRRAYEQAILTLRTTLGDTDLPPLRLEAPQLPQLDPNALDEEALVERAVLESPRLREARAQVQGARLSRTEAAAYKWPTLSLSYSVGRLVQTRESDALFDVGYDPDQLQSSFSVLLSVPFLNSYFQNRYTEVQSTVQLENQRESLRQAELEVEREVRSGLIDLRNQWESYRLAVRSAEVAARATELAREEYRLGARTFQELQQTVEQEATAQRQVITARYAMLDALLTLETAVGGFVAPAGGAGAP